MSPKIRPPKHQPRRKKRKDRFFAKLFFYLFLGLILYFGMNTLSYAETLKFVQISDVHLSNKAIDTSYKALSDSKDLLNDAINQINETPDINFVIETGDLVDKPRKELVEDACNQLKRLKSPWYFTFGNHDAAVGTSFTKDKYFEYIKKHNKNITSETAYYSFIPKKGYKAIILDSTIDTRITANGEIPQEQLEWLDCQLQESQKSNQLPLIFLHNPLHEPFPSFHHRILNAEEFKAVLDKYSMPMAVFTGHYHAAKIYKEGNILHVSTPSLVSYPNAFRIITINNLKNKVIFTFEYRETRLKDVQKKTKIMTFSSNLLKGEESDRNTVVILDK